MEMAKLLLVFLLFTGITPVVSTGNTSFLYVKDGHFLYAGERVFLSGANQAWVNYARDFGNGDYPRSRNQLERYMKEIHESGGNSIRIWIHMEGQSTPHFNNNGYVISLDENGQFLDDIKDYLTMAQEYNILVFFCLWNGALGKSAPNKLHGLIKDVNKLSTYIDNALIPFVNAVRNFASVGGWDIMNEPEGIIKFTGPDVSFEREEVVRSDILSNIIEDDPCFRPETLFMSGAGWAGNHYTIKELLRFINIQADAIHRTDPKALVTVGAWNGRSTTDGMCRTDFYKDSCLVKAGGKLTGTLDFYQIHTYDYNGAYDAYSPFKNRACDYGNSKPIVIGEFSEVSGGGMLITEQFLFAYTHKYCGAWSWHAIATGDNSDSWANQREGIRSLADFNDQSQGDKVNITLRSSSSVE